MGRIVDQTNPWGKTVDAQRSDLWFIDFNQALSGLNQVMSSTAQLSTGLAAPYVPPKLAHYFPSSVVLPDLKVRPDMIRRDSRPYNTPSYDEPLDAIRINFILDSNRTGLPNLSPYRSDVYQMLDVWRACVRAGRGGMSTEYAITLDGNYRIDYAFDVALYLLTPTIPAASGIANIQTAGFTSNVKSGLSGIQAAINTAANQTKSGMLNGDLIISMQYRLVNCWLASFKLSDLNYEGAKVSQIEAIFYADDIAQAPHSQG
jgi:hypothetical protein